MSAVMYAAPGRVNLIGEHTDYNLGFALPIALPERTEVTFVRDDTNVITVRSDRHDGEILVPLDTAPGDVTGWGGYVAGVVWALRVAGYQLGGGAMSIAGGVEMGAGLASSAALECAVLGGLATACGLAIDRIEQARIAQRAENDYVGAPTGLMDQLASLFGAPRRALLMDFCDLTVKEVPFDPEASGVVLLLINSRAPHRHAGGEYAARRASCERAAAALGVASLRDAQDDSLQVLPQVPDPVDARRARHVLTENQRVMDFVAALDHCDFPTAGEILIASHASMRDDFEITTAQIDLIADVAVGAGALGARMTGGGFGGCVIALVPAGERAAIADAVTQATAQAGYNEPTITLTRPGPGASVMRP